MVITEAKILGVPVIATKTSGALEQIEHMETGILCDFDADDIANEIKNFLDDKELQKKIRKNLLINNTNDETFNIFLELIDNNCIK
jgi:glycosyltransferase involved in cell wall biosynthesis